MIRPWELLCEWGLVQVLLSSVLEAVVRKSNWLVKNQMQLSNWWSVSGSHPNRRLIYLVV